MTSRPLFLSGTLSAGKTTLARAHLRRVHTHGVAYHLTVDTGTATPAELARAILTR